MPAVSSSTDRSPNARSRRRWVIGGVTVCAVLASAAGLAAFGPGDPSKSPASDQGKPGSGASPKSAGGKLPAGGLDVFDATTVDFDITTTATGDIRAAKQIEIRNTLDSETTIVEIIPEGSSVKAGAVLVRLNSENIQQRLDEEKLSLESSRAQVVEAEQGYQIQLSENDSARRAADLKLALAKLEFDQWIDGELMSKQQDLEHALERAEKEETRLSEKLDKSNALFSKGYYSLDQLKQDELAWEQAVNALAKARLDKDVYWEFEYPKTRKRKESDVEEAKAELDRVQRQNQSRIASKEASLNNSRSALSIREQKFSKYQEQMQGAVIKAPSDGLVVYATSIDNSRWGGDEGPLQVGSKVYPNQNLIVLPDTSEMVAAVRVHESLASRIRKGQNAVIKVEAAGGERFNGTVESIGILAEQTSRWMDPNLREYTVRIALDLPKSKPEDAEGKGKPAHVLKPSMRCEAEIMLGSVTNALAVPIQAVFNEGPLRYVHVLDGTRFVRRPVRLGQRSDRFAEIVAGLNLGERVLIRKPEASEVINKPWEESQLAAVGLKFNDQGQIISADAPAAGMPGRGRPGARPTPAAAQPSPQPAQPASSAAPAASPAPAPAPTSAAVPVK